MPADAFRQLARRPLLTKCNCPADSSTMSASLAPPLRPDYNGTGRMFPISLWIFKKKGGWDQALPRPLAIAGRDMRRRSDFGRLRRQHKMHLVVLALAPRAIKYFTLNKIECSKQVKMKRSSHINGKHCAANFYLLVERGERATRDD